jgi:hypothetical protein
MSEVTATNEESGGLVSSGVWDVGGECNAISICPTRDLIAVAGRDGIHTLPIALGAYNPSICSTQSHQGQPCS